MDSTHWDLLYDLAQDTKRLQAIQEASLTRPGFGFPPTPFLFGTAAWWTAIDLGHIASTVAEGVITHVFWGSMGDWPEFKLRLADGTESTWTREGDATRYVEGLRVRVSYAVLTRKDDAQIGAGEHTELALRIWVERSAERTPLYKGYRGSQTPIPGLYVTRTRSRAESLHATPEEAKETRIWATNWTSQVSECAEAGPLDTRPGSRFRPQCGR